MLVSEMLKASSGATLADVAQATGVSTATVSRCLNAPEKVSSATRDKVLRAVEALGYTPNFAGRVLASSGTSLVGAVVPTLENAMFASALQAFQDEMRAAGRTLLVASSGFDPDEERAQIQTLLANGAEGLMLIGDARDDETRALLARRQVPHVLTWVKGTAETACVGFDNRAAAEAMARAVTHMGHRHVGVIVGLTAKNDRAQARLDGFRAGIAATGGVMIGCVEAPYELHSGRAAMAQILAQRTRPTAVVCGNDVLAAGAMMQAHGVGISVPGDISITGFDDIALAQATNPALTTVAVPQREIGRQAARTLLARMAGAPAEPICLDTKIVRRQSLAAPRAH